MRLVMREDQNGGLGICTADVGTAVIMEDLRANSDRLPEWLVTPAGVQAQCRSVISPLKTNKNYDQTA
jgi:hypothetical protein